MPWIAPNAYDEVEDHITNPLVNPDLSAGNDFIGPQRSVDHYDTPMNNLNLIEARPNTSSQDSHNTFSGNQPYNDGGSDDHYNSHENNQNFQTRQNTAQKVAEIAKPLSTEKTLFNKIDKPLYEQRFKEAVLKEYDNVPPIGKLAESLDSYYYKNTSPYNHYNFIPESLTDKFPEKDTSDNSPSKKPQADIKEMSKDLEAYYYKNVAPNKYYKFIEPSELLPSYYRTNKEFQSEILQDHKRLSTSSKRNLLDITKDIFQNTRQEFVKHIPKKPQDLSLSVKNIWYGFYNSYANLTEASKNKSSHDYYPYKIERALLKNHLKPVQLTEEQKQSWSYRAAYTIPQSFSNVRLGFLNGIEKTSKHSYTQYLFYPQKKLFGDLEPFIATEEQKKSWSYKIGSFLPELILDALIFKTLAVYATPLIAPVAAIYTGKAANRLYKVANAIDKSKKSVLLAEESSFLKKSFYNLLPTKDTLAVQIETFKSIFTPKTVYSSAVATYETVVENAKWYFPTKHVISDYAAASKFKNSKGVLDVANEFTRRINIRAYCRKYGVSERIEGLMMKTTTLRMEVHHILTNKHFRGDFPFTPQFKEIIKKYNLDLDGSWNKVLMPHKGSHHKLYHREMLNDVIEVDKIAKGDQEIFLKLFESGPKRKIEKNPLMVRAKWWDKWQYN